MIRRKVWGLTRGQHNFAFFRRIPRSHPSSRRSRPTRQSRPKQARIGGESPNVHSHQPAFVIHGEGIPSDYRTWRRRGSSVPEQLPAPSPVRRNCHRGGIGASRAGWRDKVVAVPTSQTDRTAIGRGSSRTNSRSPARRSISRAVANQIGIVARNPRRVARRLNIGWPLSAD